MSETAPHLDHIKEKLGTKVLAVAQAQGDDVVLLDPVDLRESFRILKEDPVLGFNFLSDITAVDYWNKKEPRFELVYQLLSLPQKRRLRIRVPVSESEAAVQSLTSLWPGANFLEREVWDLFGIRFNGHPDLRRVLLYDEFQGHPLRKDYPVNLWQPLVPERHVEGTFVDERSRNKLLQLKHSLGQKS
ncbi:MAG: NADH-quinone oxidoreductase subunit C [Candidatus Binatia bacterium]